MRSGDPNRRYTDQEVALVLQRTAELEERRQSDAGGRGLTQQELESIARDAGFSIDLLREALVDLHRRGRFPRASLLGPSATARRVAAVARRLGDADLHPLIRVVEEQVAAAGTVTEALGSVRWTSVPSAHHFSPVTQVSVTPGPTETQIQVTRRYEPRVRTLMHLLPGAWGGMLGVVVAGGAGLAAAPLVAAIAGGVVAGVAIGRGVWHLVARENHRRVAELTDELTSEAHRASGGGDVRQ